MGISVEALHDKLCGRTPLFFHEVCAVHEEFFPDIELEALAWRAGGELWYEDDVELSGALPDVSKLDTKAPPELAGEKE